MSNSKPASDCEVISLSNPSRTLMIDHVTFLVQDNDDDDDDEDESWFVHIFHLIGWNI